MDETTPVIPSDLQLKWVTIHQQHLSQQYDLITKLVRSHETELALMWCATLGLTVATAILYLELRKVSSGSYRGLAPRTQ